MSNIESDLILYWVMDAVSGARVTDNSGWANHGLVRGNVSVIADAIFGTCLHFSGESGAALVLNPMLDFPEGEISVCGWVKTNAPTEQGTLLSYAIDAQPNAFTLFDALGLKISIGSSAEHASGVAFSDGLWRHMAVCWRSSDGQIAVYQDGNPAHQAIFALGESLLSGGSLVIGQAQATPGATVDPAQAFTGEMANLRIYRRMLGPSEIEQVRLADVAQVQLTNTAGQQAMQQFSVAHPLDFQLLDENNDNAVYIDHHGELRDLYLEVSNVSSQSLVLEPQEGGEPAADNNHFELLFRPGVLSEISLNPQRSDSAGWALSSTTDPDGLLRIFLLNQTGRTLDAGQKLMLGMSYAGAASPGSDRMTHVEMQYALLHFNDAQTLLSGSLNSPLQIIDLRGKINIPLHVGFAGSDTILNLGAKYPNTLTLELANAAMTTALTFQPEGSEAVTRFILSADVQPPEQQRDWALGTLSEVAEMDPEMDDPRWKKVPNTQGETPEWIFTPTEAVQLKPGEMLRLVLNNVISSLPAGSANIYLRYEHIPDYRNGQFVLPVKKSPDSIKDLPLSGGGTVTWAAPDGRLRWSQRFIAFSRENPSAYGGGYVLIDMPTGDILAEHVYDHQPRPLTADGILLKDWEALYAVHDTGKGATALSFRIVNHTLPFQTAGNWRLIAMVNGDDDTIKLGSGVTLSLGSSSSGGSPIPVGTINMWSGALDRIPGGWALCNGQNGTPDLRDRFIVGAGTTYSVNASGGANTVTLNPTEMPEHNHPASSGGAGDHFHWVEGINANGLSWRQRFYAGDTTVNMGFGGGSNGDPNDVRWRGRVNSDNQGNHSHGITVAATGGSQPHENRPPYFALAFIMKL